MSYLRFSGARPSFDARSSARIGLAIAALVGVLVLTQITSTSAAETGLEARVATLEARVDALTGAEHLVGGAAPLVDTPAGHGLSDRCDPASPDPYLECYWEKRAEEAR